MSFLDIASKVPVLGYLSAGTHYLIGDTEEGHKAFYSATRSTSVMAGGIIGSVGGPVGAAYGGVCGGYVTDLAATLITDKHQGVINDFENVACDFKRGRDPTKSIVRATAHVGLDAAGGYYARYGCRCLRPSRGVRYPSYW